MRSLAGLIALAAMVTWSLAWAAPATGPGYTAKVVHMDGAVFSGLARDGDDLLTTNLADGRLYRWSTSGGFVAFGPSLPHGPDVIGDPAGPYDVARFGDNYLVAQGWTPVDQDPGPNDHALLEVDHDSVVRVIFDDFWNPFRFTVAGQTLYVVDSARNSIEALDSAGERASIFTFARLRQDEATLTSLSPTEFSDEESYEFDAVPTGIAVHAGRIYVSLFAGFPFLPGAGKVVSLPESDKPAAMRVEREGLNAPVDVAFDAHGRMLVLEHGRYDQATGFEPESGRLVAFVGTDAAPQLLLDGLTRPVSLVVLDETTIVVCGLDGSIVFLTKSSPRSGQGATQ